MRRRRELDRLERLERAEDDLEERFVDYGEKPAVFDIAIKQSSRCDSGWSPLKPIAVWSDMHQDPATDSTEPHDRTVLRLASDQVAEFQNQVKRLRVRMRKLNGHREAVGDLNIPKLDSVSVAFLINLPYNEENEDGVLPDLVVGIQDAPVASIGMFCRWRGMRRRRQLDLLERLQRAEDDLEERFIEYEEKPIMFDASIEQSRLSNGRWSSTKPLSGWYTEGTELATGSASSNGWLLSLLASEGVAEFQRQVKRLRERMRKLNGHREEAIGAKDLKLDLLSMAFLVRMPSPDRSENDVLPDLVLAIRDVPVVE
ncbi:hypothetical protein FRC01_003480 [Tulasnella sp. 417]|nr:hypothetical protein FRC01_003480 [Tulasnella sp. 417]